MLFDDEVRVLEISIAAGTTTPVHTHRAPTVLYKVSGSQFVRRDDRDAVRFPPISISRCRGSQMVLLPRHTIENTGDDDLVMIGVELKHPNGH